MKNVLILSCSTGQGHNSCAQAVKEYFDKRDMNCEIQDTLGFISMEFSKFMSWGHSFMYRHIPGLFRWGYEYSKKHPGVFKPNSGIYKILTAGAKRMYQYIAEKQFDTVICTHVFSAIILTHMQKIYSVSLKTAMIITDYTCYPGMNAIDMQQYFIPCESLIEEFVQNGVPRERIVPTGIPVCRSFLKEIGKADAKRLLNIDAGNRHLLIMCGSMGCGPIAKMLKQIAENLPEHTEVSVICGTNRNLQKKLERNYKKSQRIHIVGYTRQMSLYMDSADLCIMKPGGLSVTEAAVKKLPMAFINAVAGCEQYNINFFAGMGAAIASDFPGELVDKSFCILESNEKWEQMETALQAYRQPDSAKLIYDFIENFCETKTLWKERRGAESINLTLQSSFAESSQASSMY